MVRNKRRQVPRRDAVGAGRMLTRKRRRAFVQFSIFVDGRSASGMARCEPELWWSPLIAAAKSPACHLEDERAPHERNSQPRPPDG